MYPAVPSGVSLKKMKSGFQLIECQTWHSPDSRSLNAGSNSGLFSSCSKAAIQAVVNVGVVFVVI
jgi:hypothetical protein